MTTLRITVEAPDADAADAVKERFFKKLLDQSGLNVTFEVPGDAQGDADEIIAFAKEAGCKATCEPYDDPIDDAAPVDFW